MDRLGRFAGTVSGRVAAVAVVAVLSGCTMCPDPYDYSGPVPNGSTPQNDFRARSTGILPLSAAPCPWPPLVERATTKGESGLVAKRVSRRTGEPTLADPLPAAEAVEQAVGAGEPVSILMVLGEETNDEEVATAPLAAIGPSIVLAEVDDVSLDVEEEVAASAAPTDQAEEATPEFDPQQPPVIPSLAETPGWRTRQLR
ncbi:MAG: hypothetical protein WD060_02645 [Pirellulales bacterium]